MENAPSHFWTTTEVPGFDADYYIARNPQFQGDVRGAIEHFMTIGWRAGQDPSQGFSTSAYLLANPDVASADINPLLHYLNYGLAEGRSLKVWLDSVQEASPKPALYHVPGFDEDFYRRTNPDLKDVQDLWTHFLEIGWKEGRDPSEGFDMRLYLEVHTDVAEAGVNPLLHYLNYGLTEGRHRNAGWKGRGRTLVYDGEDMSITIAVS